jgi:hypothetical protein
MRWPRFLTYGNWGGPGWCGGRYESDPEKVDWSVPPVDDMDAIFKMHDSMYQNGYDRNLADGFLAGTLICTNVKGLWPNIYKWGAVVGFALRALF